MRIIKFRGKSKKTSEWLIGSYIKNRGLDFIAPDEFANGKTWEDYNVNPDTVGQYTGLKDKAGKEIYEGDALRFSDGSQRVVIWNDRECGFNIVGYGIHLCEVAGNIYDNKELLKVHE